jgi:hypothetical protein
MLVVLRRDGGVEKWSQPVLQISLARAAIGCGHVTGVHDPNLTPDFSNARLYLPFPTLQLFSGRE